jgi:hypothetical protein
MVSTTEEKERCATQRREEKRREKKRKDKIGSGG